MSHHWRIAAVLALVVLILPARLARAQATEIRLKEPVTVSLPTGARVEVYGGSGHIWLKKASGPDVVVTVVKSQLAAEMPVMMLRTPEGITICAVYPSKDPKKPHECVPGGKGRLYEGNPEKLPDIGINVELPEGMAATASMGAGEVRADAVTGDVELYNDRGTVRVNDGGVGRVRANVGMLGNILAVLANGKQRREMRLNSPGMGRVRVITPKDLSVRYRVSTQVAPLIDPAMGIKPKSGLLFGSTSLGEAEVDLVVDTGITGQFVFQYALPAKKLP